MNIYTLGGFEKVLEIICVVFCFPFFWKVMFLSRGHYISIYIYTTGKPYGHVLVTLRF